MKKFAIHKAETHFFQFFLKKDAKKFRCFSNNVNIQ